MTEYVIVDIEVTDSEGYKENTSRGGQTESLEGDWQAKRLVILNSPCSTSQKLA
jgi:uncharacterized protein (DUF1330 family)